jgi:N-acetylmuramoyl-L-alanine amidase
MPKAINVKNLCLHVSAGYSKVPGIELFWKNTLKWSGKGYAVIIDVDGTKYFLDNPSQTHGYTTTYNNGKCFGFVTNGVKGFNESIISICTIGGIKNLGTKEKPIYKGVDTRTDAQKKALDEVIQLAITWLKANGKDITKDLGIVGHRDYSKDGNNNGAIESWERIKECPCIDAIEEYGYFYGSADRYGKLPTQK